MWWSAWRPIDQRSIVGWAKEHVKLPHSSRRINFDLDETPFLARAFDLLKDGKIRIVDVKKPTQGGGSTIAEVWACWLIVNDPGPMLWNMQTNEDGKEAAETRINPMFEAVRPVSDRFPHDRHKKRTTTILFPGMPLIIQGASINNAQSKSIRYEINDETWIWKPGLLTEFFARVSSYDWNHKILNVSQGSYTDDETDQSWSAGTQEFWSFACLSCGKHDQYRWKTHVKFERKFYQDGTFNMAETLPTVHIQCVHCGHKMFDEPRNRKLLNRGAKYIALNPSAAPHRASLTWNALAVEWESWGGLVEAFLNANEIRKRGDETKLREFVQKKLAETWNEEDWSLSDVRTLEPSSYTLAEVKPEEFYKVFITADVQQSELWVDIRGWQKNGDSKLIWFGKVFTEVSIFEKQTELKVKPSHVFIDAAHRTNEVYEWCLRYGWTALWGRDVVDFPHAMGQKKKVVRRVYSKITRIDPRIGTSEQGKKKISLIHWSNPSVKDILNRLRNGIPGGAKFEVAADTPQVWFEHMAAEVKKKKIDVKTGREKWFWHKVSQQNHGWDTGCEQVVAASIFGIIGQVVHVDTTEKTSGGAASSSPRP